MYRKVLLFVSSVLLLTGCDDELKPRNNNIFDAITLLESIVDNHLLPEFQEFDTDASALVIAKNIFVETPSTDNLNNLREAYFKAYLSFQSVGKYESTVTENLNFYLNLNAHPLNTNGIKAFILNQENINLSSILTQDRQGFPALDYLLYGLAETDEAILSFYTNSNANDYNSFLSKVTNRIATLTSEVKNDFENNLANKIKSDAGFGNSIFNNYLEYFEKRVRSSKVDFPAGKFDGTPSPEVIESLFNPEKSKRLLIEAFNDIELFYLGTEESESSWSKILINLEEDGLDAKIKLAILEAKNTIDDLNDNLKLQVETDNTKMLATRDKIQQVVRLLKVDVVSVLGISITFIDNDGD